MKPAATSSKSDLLVKREEKLAVILIDENGIITRANQGVEIIFGYNPQEVIGEHFEILFTDEDKIEKLPERELSRAKSGRFADDDTWMRKKDGSKVWINGQLSFIEDGGDKLFVKVMKDLSHAKNVRDELHDYRELTEGISETIRESLLILDKQMRVLYANDFFYKSFVVTKKQTIGKRLCDLGNGQWNIPVLKRMLKKVLPEKNPFEDFEVMHDFPEIGRKVMKVNARQLIFRGEPKERILLAIEDVTAEKESQQRKDDFLSMASHELKTPTTSIKAYNQIAQKLLPTKPTKVDEHLKKMEGQIDRLTKLINDMLDLSRIQSDKLTMDKSTFSFDELAKEVVETVQVTKNSHTIQLEGKTGAKVRADRERIAQVITNLITNGIKYSPGEDTIKLVLEKKYGKVALHVIDYGVGIDEKHLNKIFTRYYRIHEDDESFDGLGVGLYLSAQIAEQNGGKLMVESTKGEGSVFSLLLPIKK